MIKTYKYQMTKARRGDEWSTSINTDSPKPHPGYETFEIEFDFENPYIPPQYEMVSMADYFEKKNKS